MENSQIVQLAVTFSHFTIEVTLLNCIEQSVTPMFRLISKDETNKVCEYEYEFEDEKENENENGKPIAIKSVHYSL